MKGGTRRQKSRPHEGRKIWSNELRSEGPTRNNNNYGWRSSEDLYQPEWPHLWQQQPPPPRLTVQKFNENSDDIAAYLDTFEAIATACQCMASSNGLYLQGSLSGAGLLAIYSLPTDQQDDYLAVKAILLATYQISAESR